MFQRAIKDNVKSNVTLFTFVINIAGLFHNIFNQNATFTAL